MMRNFFVGADWLSGKLQIGNKKGTLVRPFL